MGKQQERLVIGLTYDLKDDYLSQGFSEEETAEFDCSDTIEALERALIFHGYDVRRLGNIKSLVCRLASGERWDMVFNIAEGLKGFGREGQIPALLEAYDIPYTFSDSLVLALTLHKGMTKHVLRSAGLPTPDFVVLHTREDLEHVALPYPLFAKPVAEGTGKGIGPLSKISNTRELEQAWQYLSTTFKQPVLVETYLPGREFTIGITGTGADALVMGVMEIMLTGHAEQHAYSYLNKKHYEKRVKYCMADPIVASQAEKLALAVWRVLGCRDGGRMDFRMDEAGRLSFLEINPLAGLHPVDSDLPIIFSLRGLNYNHLIGMIMDSAWKRYGNGW